MRKLSKNELNERLLSEYVQLQGNVRALGKVLRDEKSTKGKIETNLNKTRTNLVIMTGYVGDL